MDKPPELLGDNPYVEQPPGYFHREILMRQAALMKLQDKFGIDPTPKHQAELNSFLADIQKLLEMITRSN